MLDRELPMLLMASAEATGAHDALLLAGSLLAVLLVAMAASRIGRWSRRRRYRLAKEAESRVEIAELAAPGSAFARASKFIDSPRCGRAGSAPQPPF